MHSRQWGIAILRSPWVQERSSPDETYWPCGGGEKNLAALNRYNLNSGGLVQDRDWGEDLAEALLRDRERLARHGDALARCYLGVSRIPMLLHTDGPAYLLGMAISLAQ